MRLTLSSLMLSTKQTHKTYQPFRSVRRQEGSTSRRPISNSHWALLRQEKSSLSTLSRRSKLTSLRLRAFRNWPRIRARIPIRKFCSSSNHNRHWRTSISSRSASLQISKSSLAKSASRDSLLAWSHPRQWQSQPRSRRTKSCWSFYFLRRISSSRDNQGS